MSASKTAIPNRAQLEAALPHCTICHGWCLDGQGFALYGWYAVTAAGRKTFLGRALGKALETASELGASWGAR